MVAIIGIFGAMIKRILEWFVLRAAILLFIGFAVLALVLTWLVIKFTEYK
jgi:hypothetical protein